MALLYLVFNLRSSHSLIALSISIYTVKNQILNPSAEKKTQKTQYPEIKIPKFQSNIKTQIQIDKKNKLLDQENLWV